MIYRTGKYTPYKGVTQDIEMMLKFINNEETPVFITFEEYDEPFDMDDKAAPDMVKDGDNEPVSMTPQDKI